MNHQHPLEDKVAVVTGASGGIGGAVAVALAAAGADLFLSGRDRERLEATAERAASHDRRILVHAADLTGEEAVDEMAARLTEEVGGGDVLVHAAGVFHLGAVDATPVTELDRQIGVNLRAPYLLTQALLPTLRQRRGEIVFVNSSVSGRAGVGAYAASKQALKTFADSLRDEVNGDGVRVLSVFPGRTASAMQEEIHRLEGRPYHPERLLQPEDVAATVVHSLTLPRTAEVTDLQIRPMRPWADS
ncbi:MAG: SDR family NAD(P)-dependent oxidoreductase [Thermoanaerobaculia bacterium]